MHSASIPSNDFEGSFEDDWFAFASVSKRVVLSDALKFLLSHQLQKKVLRTKVVRKACLPLGNYEGVQACRNDRLRRTFAGLNFRVQVRLLFAGRIYLECASALSSAPTTIIKGVTEKQSFPGVMLTQVNQVEHVNFSSSSGTTERHRGSQFFSWVMIPERIQCKTKLVRKNIIDGDSCPATSATIMHRKHQSTFSVIASSPLRSGT